MTGGGLLSKMEKRQMALNIPINLTGINAAPAASQTNLSPNSSGAGPTDAVQPAPPSSAGSGAAKNDSSGGQPSNQQQAATTRRPPQAAPTSILAAQTQETSDDSLAAARLSAERAQDAARTKALIEAVAATPADRSGLLDRPKQVDRYAPPDPLPTAPILKQSAPTPSKPTQA